MTMPSAAAGGAAEAAQVIAVRQDEILTGEAVALDVQPVAFFLRALSAFIDMLVGLIVLLVFWGMVGWVTGDGLGAVTLMPILLIVSIVVVLVIVPTAVETATRGRSLGRLAVGARIVRVDGGAAGFRHAFIRALLGVLEIWFTVGALAGIVGAFTPRSQRLGDLLAGTYAERTRAPKLPAPIGGVPAPLTGWAAVADVARLPDRIARRAARFVRSAEGMDPGARTRAAASIAREIAPFVFPVPPVDPEMLVRGVAAVRRDREYAALRREAEQLSTVTAGITGAPRGFPER